MILRVLPFNVYLDVEGTDQSDCLAKARAVLEGAGFKPMTDEMEAAFWEVRDERAITGADSGSPYHCAYNPEKVP